jgi:hypothetical protein
MLFHDKKELISNTKFIRDFAPYLQGDVFHRKKGRFGGMLYKLP